MNADVIGRLIPHVVPGHEPVAPGESVWTAWSLDILLVVPVLLVSVLYLRGLARWTERSRPHPWWRTASYFAGLGVLLLAVESPLDALGEQHFSFHMVQHELIIMFAAPLVLLGAPTTPVLRGLPRSVKRRVVSPLARNDGAYRVFRFVTHPLVAGGIFIAVLWAWHVTPGWYNAAVEHRPIHDLQHVSFFVIGVLFWWNVIDPAPMRARMPYLLRIGYLLAVSTPKHFLGAYIVFTDEVLFTAYERIPRYFDISLVDDESIGGLIMWVPSQMMHLVAMAIVFGVWAHKSEQQQQVEDAQMLRQQSELAAEQDAGQSTRRSQPGPESAG